MIPILFASTLIATRRLQMPVRIAADPHLFPRRRYRQCADAFQRRDVAHQRAVGQTIIEPVARVAARNPRHRIIDVTQLCAPRGDSRIVCCFERCNGIDFPLFYVIGFASKWRCFHTRFDRMRSPLLVNRSINLLFPKKVFNWYCGTKSAP
jgi:hypothetical protein